MANNNILKQKIWMKKAQADAKKIMVANSEIWEKYNWRSGGEVKQDILKQELKKKFGEQKFDPVVAEVLEDANFHSINQALQESGAVRYKGTELKRYRKLGGRTWDIF